MSTDLMTIEQFANTVAEAPVPMDNEVTGDWLWEFDGYDVRFGDRKAGPLPMYQAKSLYGQSGIDLRGTKAHIARAVSGQRDSEFVVRRQVAQLNAAAREHELDARPLLARTYLDSKGVEHVGGIVTPRYAPITHDQLVNMMVENVGLQNAMVYRTRVDESRLDATILFDNEAWKVDGGLKRGIFLKNGQFGDYSYGYSAMLFRLLCTNGMKDIVSEDRVFKRHLEETVDLAADIAAAMSRSDTMFSAGERAMSIEIDVIEILIELHRRKFLNRGALRKSLDRVEEVNEGVVVEGALTTLWGLAQAITAAGRDYSFTQFDNMAKLAGRLVFEGADTVLATKPLLVDAPQFNEVYEEFVENVA